MPKALAAVLGIWGFRRLLLKRVWAFHTASTFVQETTQNFLARAINDDERAAECIVIPDAIATSESNDQTDWAKQLPAPPFILFVGALQTHKGIHRLLEAYTRLKSPPPLVLIGTSWPDTPQEFPAGVKVIMDASHDGVMYAWARSLFGVAPSLCAETFGDVIVEAMSHGKLVIASNIGGPVDILADNETGLLVPPGDVGALVSAMSRLLDDEEVRNRMGRAAKVRAEEYSVDVVVPQFEEMYSRLIRTVQEHTNEDKI